MILLRCENIFRTIYHNLQINSFKLIAVVRLLEVVVKNQKILFLLFLFVDG